LNAEHAEIAELQGFFSAGSAVSALNVDTRTGADRPTDDY